MPDVTPRMSTKEYRRRFLGGDESTPAKASKYRNKPVRIDGIRFDSQIEAAYYLFLLSEKKAGRISYFLRQVAIHLPARRYVVDFLVFRCRSSINGDGPAGSHEYIDVKGQETDMFRHKRDTVHAVHREIFIRCVRREEIDKSYINTVKELVAHERQT